MDTSFAAMSRLKVEYWKLAALIPYAKNARRHSRAQIKLIANSIKRFGWTSPILIRRDGTIVAGHGRYEGAKLLKIAKAPVIVLEDMSDEDVRAYILADNALAEQSGWDKDILRSELKVLADLGYDLELTGFSTLQIDTLLNIGEPPPEGEPAVELPGDEALPVSRVGDRWTIGDHRVVCGDGRDRDVVERLMAGASAQMVFTDPPYNVRIAGNVSGLGSHKHGEFVMGSGELSDGEFENALLRPVLKNIARVSAAGAIAFVCMDWHGNRILQDAAEGIFDELKNLIVWAKTNAGMGSFYRSQHELIFSYKVSPGAHINNFGLGGGGRHRSNLWTYAGANTFRRGRDQDLADHPTVKPVQLVADAILDCSKPNGVIFDPFLGAGTTIVAAAKTGRRGYGIELDPKYCDVALRRIAEATGATPMLDGKTYDEVAAERRGDASDG